MNDPLELTTQIVAAHVARNEVESDQIPDLIRAVFDALNKAGRPPEESKSKEPAVPVKKSVFNDHLVCLECGGDFKILKRHIQADHNMTIDQYRERFGLPRDYPTVAPDYATRRSVLANESGFGRIAAAKQWRKRA